MAVPCIAWKIVITANSNDDLNFKEDGGGEQKATLDAGSYDPFGSDTTDGSIAKEIKTQLEATGAGTYSVSVSAAGLITIAVSGGASTFQLLGSTGTDVATSCRYEIGLGATDTANAASNTLTSQTYGLFLFDTDGPDLSADTEDRREIMAPQNRAADGTMITRPWGSFVYEREISINIIPRAKMFSASNVDKSIEAMFAYLGGGNSRTIRLYPDASDDTDYDTYHVASNGNYSIRDWRRLGPGTERWSGDLVLRKHV